MKVEDVIKHAREREYMSGVARSQNRVKATSEIFTPTELVQEVLDKLPASEFVDPSRTFIDNSCGDGQFLSEVLIRKVQNGIDIKTALETIYGVDMMEDNVALCRERLMCGREDLREIVEKNIVCHNALTYEYNFGDAKYLDDSD